MVKLGSIWGFGEDDEAYAAMLDQFREFAWIGPIYWLDEPAEPSTASWDGGPRRFVMNRREKLYFTERQADEARYLMAVNVDTAPLTARFTMPGLKAGDVVQVMFENRAVTVDGDSFTDVFAGPQVHVYRLASGL